MCALDTSKRGQSASIALETQHSKGVGCAASDLVVMYHNIPETPHQKCAGKFDRKYSRDAFPPPNKFWWWLRGNNSKLGTYGHQGNPTKRWYARTMYSTVVVQWNSDNRMKYAMRTIHLLKQEQRSHSTDDTWCSEQQHCENINIVDVKFLAGKLDFASAATVSPVERASECRARATAMATGSACRWPRPLPQKTETGLSTSLRTRRGMRA